MEQRNNEVSVYRVEGMSCAGCAATFEKNVKSIHSVKEASINFGAAKLTVVGEATIAQLEKAGAFDHLKIKSDEGTYEIEEDDVPFVQKHWREMIALLFIGAGYGFQSLYGEGSTLSIVMFAISMLVGGLTLFKTGLIHLTKLQFDMKTLMTVAVIGAAIIGEWSEGAIVVFLFAISESLERYSMDKARQSIRSLMGIAPKEALITRDGKEMYVHVKDIVIGDMMIVKPGEKIAMDGVVRSGFSHVNQASITGESIPVEKTVGADIFAGTLNEDGVLYVEVTKLVQDTTIAKIIHLVEEAQGERAPSQAFVDTFAKYYTPIIMIVAALIAIVPPLLGASWETWIYQGLAVLVVGCPCALIISTPVSIVTAIGNAARHGILIKGGVYLEQIGAIKAIAFDKTGTLTEGKPVVTNMIVVESYLNEQDLLRSVAALEHRSQHPLAQSFIQKAEDQGITFDHVNVESFRAVVGKGIYGEIDGAGYYIGSPTYYTEEIGVIDTTWADQMKALQSEGKTVMLVFNSQQLLAIFAVADDARSESKQVISFLHEHGISKTMMLTGDNKLAANAIGAKLGIMHVESELLPEEKLTYIKDLQQSYGKIAMVGDGVNDAPALAAATVGIAMGGAGTDTALETADVALMADDLNKIPYLMKLSRKTVTIIKQNITFSLGIKIIALLLVIPGWLTLWIAILADMGATLLVTLNGLRLLRIKEK